MKTRAEVRKKLTDTLAQIDQEQFIEKTDMTVAEWLTIWQRDYIGNVKRGRQTMMKSEKEINMDDEMLETIEEKVREVVEDVLGDKIDDLADEIADELEDRLADIIDEAVNDSIIEYFSEGIEEFLSSHQLALNDGTTLQMRQKTRVMSPDKKKVIICYGGMRVDGKSLQIQTRISCWETLWSFETEDKAVDALQKVSAAIEQGVSLIEL